MLLFQSVTLTSIAQRWTLDVLLMLKILLNHLKKIKHKIFKDKWMMKKITVPRLIILQHQLQLEEPYQVKTILILLQINKKGLSQPNNFWAVKEAKAIRSRRKKKTKQISRKTCHGWKRCRIELSYLQMRLKKWRNRKLHFWMMVCCLELVLNLLILWRYWDMVPLVKYSNADWSVNKKNMPWKYSKRLFFIEINIWNMPSQNAISWNKQIIHMSLRCIIVSKHQITFTWS